MKLENENTPFTPIAGFLACLVFVGFITHPAEGATIIVNANSATNNAHNAVDTGFAFNPIDFLTTEPLPPGGSTQYFHGFPPQDFHFVPELTGTYLVEASWGQAANHPDAVDYYFDPDGHLTGAGETLILADVDHRLSSTGTGPIVTAWSGFLELGTFALTPDSVFILDNDDTTTNGNLPVAAWRFTTVPEPSSTALLGLGGLAMLMRRRR